MVQQHFERSYGVLPESVRVVYSAIDPLRFAADDRLKRRQAERERWGVKPEETVGLFVAMNYRLKGLAPLIRAAARMPRDKPWRVAIVGHPRYARYQRLAEHLRVADRILFLGHRDDPKEAYFAADYLVHPTFYDPCSLVALESLACGLPVVTSRFNGASELLAPPADGLVIDNPHDADSLASAMSKMLDHGYRSAASQAARQTGNRWTFEHHYRALLDVFSEVRAIKQAA
jgi:UDP-glucose:(heptosyl)LPS alpha-1,3-glucosyltransferase